MDAERRSTIGMMTVGNDLRHAVTSFRHNLVTIREEISTSNMAGQNNFSEAIRRLDFILEKITAAERARHLVYPMPDERCRRRTKSACRTERSDGRRLVERPKSSGCGRDNFDSDFLVEDINEELKIQIKKRSVR